MADGASIRGRIHVEWACGPRALTCLLHLAGPGVPTCPHRDRQAGSQSPGWAGRELSPGGPVAPAGSSPWGVLE